MTKKYRKRTSEEIAFEREVAHALDELPEWVRRQLANVAIVVEEQPTPEENHGLGEAIYAYYNGVPLGAEPGPFPLPGRIVLFRQPLMADFSRGTRLRREIRRTIVHEIAHHFGMSEEEIARLGYE
ncbi:MAG: metallopeptidase family protein [Chloroflexi bacterium]|nr:metallopeptidase family protein [Chloroflexota bacterium]